MSFSWGRFDTRTIVLIPIAIAINIVLGQTVGRRAEGADLPGLDRDDPRRRPCRPDPGARHRPPREPDLDLRAAGPVRSRLRGAVRDRRGRRSASWPGSSPSSASSAAGRTPTGRVALGPPSLVVLVLGAIGFYGFLPFYAGADFKFFGDTSTAVAVLRGPRLRRSRSGSSPRSSACSCCCSCAATSGSPTSRSRA